MTPVAQPNQIDQDGYSSARYMEALASICCSAASLRPEHRSRKPFPPKTNLHRKCGRSSIRSSEQSLELCNPTFLVWGPIENLMKDHSSRAGNPHQRPAAHLQQRGRFRRERVRVFQRSFLINHLPVRRGASQVFYPIREWFRCFFRKKKI